MWRISRSLQPDARALDIVLAKGRRRAGDFSAKSSMRRRRSSSGADRWSSLTLAAGASSPEAQELRVSRRSVSTGSLRRDRVDHSRSAQGGESPADCPRGEGEPEPLGIETVAADDVGGVAVGGVVSGWTRPGRGAQGLIGLAERSVGFLEPMARIQASPGRHESTLGLVGSSQPRPLGGKEEKKRKRNASLGKREARKPGSREEGQSVAERRVSHAVHRKDAEEEEG